MEESRIYFDIFDVDRSGTIDSKELQMVMKLFLGDVTAESELSGKDSLKRINIYIYNCSGWLFIS